VPGQTEGGSRVPASPLCFAAPHSWVVISVPSSPFHHDPFACSSDLKSSHFMSCHFTLANFISSHLISCCVFPAFFTTSHLIPTHLMSSLLFSAHLISSRLMSTALFSLFCHLSPSHLITSHQNSSLFSFSQRLHSSQFFFNWATCHRSSETCVSSFCLISSLIFRAAALFFSILFSSSFSSPHLSVSVSCFPYMFTFADIPSNLFPFPARHRSRGQTQVQLEVGSLRGPQRRTQLVFVGHDGIIQAFARDFLEKMKVKMWQRSFRARLAWKMCKRSFGGRLPWKIHSWRCEIEAFVRDFPHAWSGRYSAGPIRPWSEDARDRPATARGGPSPSIFWSAFCAAKQCVIPCIR